MYMLTDRVLELIIPISAVNNIDLIEINNCGSQSTLLLLSMAIDE